jgi:hypothetical protein
MFFFPHYPSLIGEEENEDKILNDDEVKNEEEEIIEEMSLQGQLVRPNLPHDWGIMSLIK